MFPERLTPAVRVFLSLLILQAHLQQAFSSNNLFCNNEQERSMIAIDGQTIHVNFTVDELQENQYLVWNIPDSEFQLPFDMSIGNNMSLQSGRYSLTYFQQAGHSYEMSIMLTDKHDTGTHTVTLNEGGRQLCFIFLLNLIIKETNPICETLFDKKRGKLQLSCQWLQVNDWDRARLVAGDQVLYEHETFQMNLDGHYNVTNKYSIFLPPEKLYDAFIVPTMCEVVYTKTNRSNTCRFRTAPGDFVRSNLAKSENATFTCCNTSWFTVDSSSLKRLNSTESISASFPILLCGVEGDDSNMLVIRSIGYLNVDVQENLDIVSVLMNATRDPNASNYSSDGFQCQILTVYTDNISKGRSLSATVTLSTQGTEHATDWISISEESYKKAASMETYLMAVLVVSTIAHGVSIIAFVFSYRRA